MTDSRERGSTQAAYENGIMPMVQRYEITPSPRARRILYYLQEVGHGWCSTHELVEQPGNNSFLLLAVLKGKMQVTLEGSEATICAGEFAFLHCSETYRFRAMESLDYLWIYCNGGNMWAFCDEVRHTRGIVIRPDHVQQVQRQMLNLIEQIHLVGRYDEVSASRDLHDLMCALLYSNRFEEVEDPQIAAVQRFLAEHLNEEMSTADLAKKFHLSISQLNRRFRESVGQSPHEYLVNLRVNHGKTLLKESRMSIAEIAGEVGYAYDTSFAAVFRNKVGVSPRQYRNMSI